MARQIVDLEGLCKLLPLTPNQAYKAVRDPTNPIPYKKWKKRLWFDVEKVYRWFDGLPGKENENI